MNLFCIYKTILFLEYVVCSGPRGSYCLCWARLYDPGIWCGAQLASCFDLSDRKWLIRMMHQTLLMMHLKLFKLLDIRCILGIDIYTLRFLKVTWNTSTFSQKERIDILNENLKYYSTCKLYVDTWSCLQCIFFVWTPYNRHNIHFSSSQKKVKHSSQPEDCCIKSTFPNNSPPTLTTILEYICKKQYINSQKQICSNDVY